AASDLGGYVTFAGLSLLPAFRRLHPNGSSDMRTFTSVALSALLLATPALAKVQPFPPGFKTETISTNSASIFVRVGGHGSAVVLLHGYGETGDMWAPLAVKLARDRT